MVDVEKLKTAGRSRLGAPPPRDDARDDLAEPSVRYDMRSLRRTNRTVAFSTRITAELDARIRTLAMRDNIMLTELLERAIEAYDRGDPK